MSLPRSALLALWLTAAMDGRVGPDDHALAVRQDDPQHLVTDWPGTELPFPLDALPAAVRGLGADNLGLALPVPGDLLGLAGPASFNGSAVEAGEAVLLSGRTGTLGLVPTWDARTVLWRVSPVERPPLTDPAEESRTLRQVLLQATAELVRLDVAGWQPEIPDLLLNLRHREPLPLPPGTPVAHVETLERADLCREIVALARLDDGGALTGSEAAARTRCLTELDVAARRAIVACCSASLVTS